MRGVITIGQMRSTARFQLNTPTQAATTRTDAIVTGGQVDVYTDFYTTRCRLRQNSASKGLDMGFLGSNNNFEMVCRFDLNMSTLLYVNGKVYVDSVLYTIQSWEVVDQVKHWLKIQLTKQVGS